MLTFFIAKDKAEGYSMYLMELFVLYQFFYLLFLEKALFFIIN
jgi:hypothetical protein